MWKTFKAPKAKKGSTKNQLTKTDSKSFIWALLRTPHGPYVEELNAIKQQKQNPKNKELKCGSLSKLQSPGKASQGAKTVSKSFIWALLKILDGS